MNKTLSFILALTLCLPFTPTMVASQTSAPQDLVAKRKALRAKLASDLNTLLEQDDEDVRSGGRPSQWRLNRLTRTPRPFLKGDAVPATEVPADAPQTDMV